MKPLFKYVSVFFSVVISACAVYSGAVPSTQDKPLPDIILPVPQSEAHQKYLGLSGEKTFSIAQIKAQVVIVEFFSLY